MTQFAPLYVQVVRRPALQGSPIYKKIDNFFYSFSRAGDARPALQGSPIYKKFDNFL